MTYTPTTEEIRDQYASQGWTLTFQEFDRWLAEHDREVAAKAWALGYAQGKEDERLAETLKVDIGLGGHAAANRQNPYEETP